MLGALFTMFVSFVSSFAFGLNDPTTISADLITPLLRKRIFKDQNKSSGQKLSPAVMKDTEFWWNSDIYYFPNQSIKITRNHFKIDLVYVCSSWFSFCASSHFQKSIGSRAMGNYFSGTCVCTTFSCDCDLLSLLIVVSIVSLLICFCRDIFLSLRCCRIYRFFCRSIYVQFFYHFDLG